MQSTKLINILHALGEEEFKALKKFIRSDYFNTDPNLLKLYRALHPFFPDFDSKKLTKENIFNKIFAGEQWNDRKWRNLVSKKVKLLEEYLVITSLRNNHFERQKILGNAYEERSLTNYYGKTSYHLLNILEEQPFRDANYFHHKFWLTFDLKNKLDAPDLKKSLKLLDESNQLLDAYYSHLKVCLQADIEGGRSFTNHQFPVYELGRLPTKFKDINTGWFYFNIIKMHTSQNDDLFLKIKNEFINFYKNINIFWREEIWSHLLNYTLRRMKINDIKFNKYSFELYKFGIANELMISKGKILKNTFYNIVVSAAKDKDFKWANQFIVDYHNYLNIPNKNELITLCKAYIFFQKKEYEKTIYLISSNKFTDRLNEADARNFLTRALFELYLIDQNYYSSLVNNLDAFYKYLKREKMIGKEKIESYINFIYMIKKILEAAASLNKSLEAKKALANKLSAISKIWGRSWLQEKIDGL